MENKEYMKNMIKPTKEFGFKQPKLVVVKPTKATILQEIKKDMDDWFAEMDKAIYGDK